MTRLLTALLLTSCSATPLPTVAVSLYHCGCDIECETGTATAGGVIRADSIFEAEIEFEYNRCTIGRPCGREATS